MFRPGVVGMRGSIVVEPECSRTRASWQGNGMQELSELAREAASLVQETSFCVVVVVLFLFMMKEGREL